MLFEFNTGFLRIPAAPCSGPGSVPVADSYRLLLGCSLQLLAGSQRSDDFSYLG